MHVREHLSVNQAHTLIANGAPSEKATASEPTRVPPQPAARARAPLLAAHPSLALPFVLGDGRETGFVLADGTLRPLYTNNAANAILWYPERSREIVDAPALQERIRSIFPVERFTPGMSAGFVSGRRRYICRSLLIDVEDDASSSPMIALLLERRPRNPIDAAVAGLRFHLSRREGETVQYLIQGLTTKEVAQRMGVSPNTVKQFVRLIMSKMGVTTRSGIVGKLISG